MGESIKFNKYIDGSGLHYKTQNFIPTGVDVSSYVADRCYYVKRGNLITVFMQITMTSNANAAQIVKTADLGINGITGVNFGLLPTNQGTIVKAVVADSTGGLQIESFNGTTLNNVAVQGNITFAFR